MRLRNKILWLFTALLVVSCIATITSVIFATDSYIRNEAENKLSVGQKVFNQLLEENKRQLIDSASVLVADFGFKSAVATFDPATIRSAILNNSERINADIMLILTLDGELIASTEEPGTQPRNADFSSMVSAAQNQRGFATIALLTDSIYEVVLLPVKAPARIAWALIGRRIDTNFAANLKEITGLDVTFLGGVAGHPQKVVSTFSHSGILTQIKPLTDADTGYVQATTDSNTLLTLPQTLSERDGIKIEAFLTISLSESYAKFLPLQGLILFITLITLVISVFAAFIISGNVSRPIAELAKVAGRISKGDYHQTILPESGNDREIAALNDSFRTMQNGIADREEKLKQQAHDLDSKNLELSNMLDELQLSSQLKDQFLATISHELRTPMNGIQTSLNLLSDDMVKADGQDMLSAAKHSTHLMTQILESLLEFSELESGKLEIIKRPFVLSELVAESIRGCQASASAKGVDFIVKIVDETGRFIVSDEARIQNLLFQVIDNALKFTHEGKISLLVTLGRLPGDDGHELVLQVEDTGIGISEEHQPHVFEKFRQVDGSFSRQYGGLGIGLSLVKALVELMDGEVAMQSKLAAGTTVVIRLPVELGDKLPAASGADARSADSREVLIVEDNPVNQLTLKALLKKLGYSVQTANNGLEGVEKALETRFDCILMDCQMPVMDGFEATENIRSQPGVNQTTPIIAVTANAMSADKQRCLAVGMNDYLKKPVAKKTLQEAMNHWLGNR